MMRSTGDLTASAPAAYWQIFPQDLIFFTKDAKFWSNFFCDLKKINK